MRTRLVAAAVAAQVLVLAAMAGEREWIFRSGEIVFGHVHLVRRQSGRGEPPRQIAGCREQFASLLALAPGQRHGEVEREAAAAKSEPVPKIAPHGLHSNPLDKLHDWTYRL